MAAPLVILKRTNCRRIKQVILFSYSLKNYSTETIKSILQGQNNRTNLSFKGWVKNVQRHKGVTFLHVNDGSGPQHIQVVIPQDLADDLQVTFGSCVKVNGSLQESIGKGQSVEVLTNSCEVIGPCNVNEYPLKQRTRHPAIYTRDFLHLRPKTNIFSALLRIRNVASMAVHTFFQQEGYLFIHTPILTSSDCEGACEVFKAEPLKSDILSALDSDTDDDFGKAPKDDKTKDEISRPSFFFKQPAYLTVSGQLHLEIMTGAFKKVYNFGPTFRAENSRGSFHLSEFYMVEAELAFIESMDDLSEVMEKLVKFVYKTVWDSCPEDVSLFSNFVASPHYKVGYFIMSPPAISRMTYTDAIDVLSKSGELFKYKPHWGCDLKKEHEMYLTKVVNDRPVFITDYPADIKPFYARRNNDGLTVSALDLLVPGVGELCGSSLREERADVLGEIMKKQGILEQLSWYHELRQYGTCPHGGFGLGFERLLLAILGAESLKDVIPFPRWPRNCLT
ncbi:unnamed protein product [Lymnaea stagnalis]|uniref:asparagine--tRNA ligase n=1 Tax=Lymnaea stagnalis TaxID=6523 RepID=A0AAV2I869_LYMST